MNRIVTKRLVAVLAGCLVAMAAGVRAEGDPAPTYERERAMQRYKGCQFTDEMGQFLYACVRKNDGFGTHWCYDETLETYCPAQMTGKQTGNDAQTQDKPAN